MAFTQAQLDALESAISSGTRRVRDQNGTEVEYRSLGEMRLARDEIRKALGLVRHGGIRKITPQMSKGIS